MKTKYEVRFSLYHYNTGRGNNGIFPRKEIFDNKIDALVFANKLMGMLVSREPNFQYIHDEFHIDGYLSSVYGVYEVTEKKIC